MWNTPSAGPGVAVWERTIIRTNDRSAADQHLEPMAKGRPVPADRTTLRHARRLVIKLGSAVLAPEGRLDQSSLERLAGQIVPLVADGVAVTVVSSGAVASGFRALGFDAPPTSIVHKQSAAAVGQPRLMAAWAKAFGEHGVTVAQALYTAEDLATRPRYLNTRRTLAELLSRGVVPIVNENDTTSFDEIKLGDNDRLSALTADLVDAELLLILSTAKGLYENGDPNRVIPEVRVTDRTASRNVTADKTSTGTGGMATKLSAAGTAAKWGIATVVAGGREPGIIQRVLAGETVGTLFLPGDRAARARKRWLGAAARTAGVVLVDAGAAKAIVGQNGSLLPTGVVAVRGAFGRNDVVEIAGPDGRVIARGVTAYDSEEVGRLAGKKTRQIGATLGYCLCDEIVHRSDLVLEGGQ